MNINNNKKSNNKKLSSKHVIIIAITIIAVIIQLTCIGKTHIFPFPPSINCEMVLTQKSLPDGSTLIVDSQGKRMLFTNPQGQLINVVEINNQNSKFSKIAEISTNDEGYIVHGVKEINGGIYLSSECFALYDNKGNYKDEISRTEFSDDEYITSIDLVFDSPLDYFYSSMQITEKNLPLSTEFLIKNLLFYISAAYLIIVGVVLIVWFARKKASKKSKLALVAAVFIIAAITLYSVAEYNYTKNQCENNITQAAKQINSALQTEESVQQLATLSDTGIFNYLEKPENETKFNNLKNYLYEICKKYGKEQSIYVRVILANANSKENLLFDNRNEDLTGMHVEISQDIAESMEYINIEDIIHLSLPSVDTLYSASSIKKADGQNLAYLIVGSNTDNLFYLQASKSFDLFIKLIALLIGIYVAISALIMCINSIKRSLKQKTQNLSERIANLSGMYMLIFKFAYSIDSFLVVYICESITTGLDPAQKAMLAAAPIALFYAGQWIGTLLSAPLINKFGERNLAIISSIISIFIMLFLAWAVFCGDIVLYSVGRFLLGFVVSGVLYVISGTLPICAKDKQQRRIAIESSMRGSIAAAIITTLIGGYTSEFAGYLYIYFIGAAMCGLLLFMTIFTFGKRNALGSQDSKSKLEKHSIKGSWRIFIRPELLMYIIFFCIPDLLISGYSSYIFPLIASNSGMPVVLLSNLGVFSLTLTYLCQNEVDKFTKQYKSTKMLVLPSLAICIGLLCFIISPNIYWASILMLAIGTLTYMTNVSETEYIVETSEKYNQNPTLVQSNYYTIYSGIQTVSTPTLSTFMLLGLYPGCAVLGAVCGVMYVIFGSFCKKRS